MNNDTVVSPVPKPGVAGLKNRYFVAGCLDLKKKKNKKSTGASMMRGIVVVISFLYRENGSVLLS